jgi:hypothetical protein
MAPAILFIKSIEKKIKKIYEYILNFAIFQLENEKLDKGKISES